MLSNSITARTLGLYIQSLLFWLPKEVVKRMQHDSCKWLEPPSGKRFSRLECPCKWRSRYFTRMILRYGRDLHMCVLTRYFSQGGTCKEVLAKWCSQGIPYGESCEFTPIYTCCVKGLTQISQDCPHEWWSRYFTTFLLLYGWYIYIDVSSCKEFLRGVLVRSSCEYPLVRYSWWEMVWIYVLAAKESAHAHPELIGAACRVYGPNCLLQAIWTIYIAWWTDKGWRHACKFFGGTAEIST
jgi:hypothetical protein